MALRCMDPPITMEHVFSSDCMPAAKRLSELMFKPKVFKDDVNDVSKKSCTDVGKGWGGGYLHAAASNFPLKVSNFPFKVSQKALRFPNTWFFQKKKTI